MKRRDFITLLGGAAAAWPLAARAQVYPSRPVTIVVPFPAGGPTDTLARILTEHMRTSLGQPVIIENVSGAGGSIGVGRVARAAPDGYTVSIGHWGTHVLNGASYQLQYDVEQDFEPVSLLADTPQWIVARKTLPAKDLRELIAWLKENPGKAIAGTVGVGGGGVIAAIYFQKSTGTSFALVPYRGAAPLYQDMLAGHIDFAVGQAASTFVHVRNGDLKAYAVMAKTRWAAALDIPTIDEAGVLGLYASYWHGLWVPKGTPKETIKDSIRRCRMLWLMQPCSNDLPIKARTFHRASSRRLKRLPRNRRLRLKNGGRSSGQRTWRTSRGNKSARRLAFREET